MRIKILLVGDDPVSLVADGQLLKERGLMVFSTFNLQNIDELIGEVKPDLLFFDPRKSSNSINEVYNKIVSSRIFNKLPIVFTLSDDDVYLVNRKRTESKERKNLIADNIIDALKIALRSNKTYQPKTHKLPDPNTGFHPLQVRA